MICQKCNFQNELTAKFCRNCGTQLYVILTPPTYTQKPKSNTILWVLLVVVLIACAFVGGLLYHNPNNDGLCEPYQDENNNSNDVENNNVVIVNPPVNPQAMFTKGTGNETGSGSGSGTGYGSGIGTGGNTSFSLVGRPVVHKEYPPKGKNIEGKVVVDFRADRDGNVVYAKVNSRETTIGDLQIREECERAALKSKFAPRSDAEVEEKGVITYFYVIQ